MKATHYVLSESEHQMELSERLVNVPNPQKDPPFLTQTIPPALRMIDRESIDLDLRLEALKQAGIDKYVGGVGFGVLDKDWRVHKAGAAVVRHINSSGYNVTVIDDLRLEAPKTGSGDAGDDVAQLEAQRQAQKDADDKKRDPAGNVPPPPPTPPVPTLNIASKDSAATETAANDNQEKSPKAPAAGSGG